MAITKCYKIRPRPENQKSATYFRDSLQQILEIVATDVEASDMLGFQITNSKNSVDRPIGLSFRRKDQNFCGCHRIRFQRKFASLMEILIRPIF
jgi:hypothetical protein